MNDFRTEFPAQGQDDIDHFEALQAGALAERERASNEEASLTAIASEVRTLSQRMVTDAWRIGRLLLEAREHFPSSTKFGQWRAEHLEESAGITSSTATRMMHIASRWTSLDALPSSISLSTLYNLAAPSTPQHVCDEMVEQLSQRPEMTVREANNMVAQAKDLARNRRLCGESPEAAAARARAESQTEAAREARKAAQDERKAADEAVSDVYAIEKQRVRSLLNKSEGKRKEHLAAFVQACREAGILHCSGGASIYVDRNGHIRVDGE